MKSIAAKIKRLFVTTPAAPLLAALVVAGAVVILALLRQSRAHDNAEAQRQSGLRDDAIAARAKLIAGVMGVLLSDTQTALAATLDAVPRDGMLPFLERWREVNPLVSDAVLVNALGTSGPGEHWPRELAREYESHAKPLSTVLTDWLASTPWHPGAVAEKPARSASPPAAAALESLRKRLRAVATRDPWRVHGAIEAIGSDTSDISAGSVGSLPPSNEYAKTETWPERRRRLGIPFTERSGWDGAPGGLFAWRMCDDDMVLVASVDLRELANTLAAAIPATADAQDGGACILFTGSGDGGGAAGDFICDVPVHPELLPGWAVLAMRKTLGGAASRGGVLYTSSVIFVVLATVLALWLLYIFQRRMRENEMTARVTGYATHEMGTQVQKIIFCTEPEPASADDPGGKTQPAPVTDEHITTIYYASRRLLETTDLVLDFFPKIMRRAKIYTEDVNLVRLAAELVKEYKITLQNAGVGMDLQSSLPPGPLVAKTNEKAVSLILRNLLENACLRAGVSGRASLSLAENPAAGTVEFRVRDHGPGIPRRELGRIFKPCWRPGEEERGNSLGLPLSRQLARALGGDMFCEIPSDGGGGSIFIISLPMRNKCARA